MLTYRCRPLSEQRLDQLEHLHLSVPVNRLLDDLEQMIPEAPCRLSMATNEVLQEVAVQPRCFTCREVDEGRSVRVPNSVFFISMEEAFRHVQAALAESREDVTGGSLACTKVDLLENLCRLLDVHLGRHIL